MARTNGNKKQLPDVEQVVISPDDVFGSPETLAKVLDALEWTESDSPEDLKERAASLHELTKPKPLA